MNIHTKSMEEVIFLNFFYIIGMETADHAIYQTGWDQSSTLSVRIADTSSFPGGFDNSCLSEALLPEKGDLCKAKHFVNESTDRHGTVSKLALQAVSDRCSFGLVLASLSTLLLDNLSENQDVRLFKIMMLMCVFTPLQPRRPALGDVMCALRFPNPNTL